MLGNKSDPALNAVGKIDQNHTKVYRLVDITAHPEVHLTRGGMILIGLMKGGDYHPGGLVGCGPIIAHALARCGFGDSLLQAAKDADRDKLAPFLTRWRHDLRHELLTNSRGYLRHVPPSLTDIPDSFPDIDVLLSYVNPLNWETMGNSEYYQQLTWSKEPDLPKLAGICESKFDWGCRDAIMKRFKANIWFPVVMRILRRIVLFQDDQTQATAGKTMDKTLPAMILKYFTSVAPMIEKYPSEHEPGEPFLVKIHSSRSHVSTDRILEYRLEITPTLLERMAESGIKGLHIKEVPRKFVCSEKRINDRDKKERGENKEQKREEGRNKSNSDPDHHIRVWVPACMVDLVEPGLVAEYKAIQKKHRKKATAGHCEIIERIEASVPQASSGGRSARAPQTMATLPPLLSLYGCLPQEENRGYILDLTKKKITQPPGILSGTRPDLKALFPTTKNLRRTTEKVTSGRNTVYSQSQVGKPSQTLLSSHPPPGSNPGYRMQEEPQTRTLEISGLYPTKDPCALTLASGGDELFQSRDRFPVTQPPLTKYGRKKVAASSSSDSDSDLSPPKKTRRKTLNHTSSRSGGSSSTPSRSRAITLLPGVIEIPSDPEEASNLSPKKTRRLRTESNRTFPRSGYSIHTGSSSTPPRSRAITLLPGVIEIPSDPEDALPQEVITISSDSEDDPAPSMVSSAQDIVSPSAKSRKAIPSIEDLIDLT